MKGDEKRKRERGVYEEKVYEERVYEERMYEEGMRREGMRRECVKGLTARSVLLRVAAFLCLCPGRGCPSTSVCPRHSLHREAGSSPATDCPYVTVCVCC